MVLIAASWGEGDDPTVEISRRLGSHSTQDPKDDSVSWPRQPAGLPPCLMHAPFYLSARRSPHAPLDGPTGGWCTFLWSLESTAVTEMLRRGSGSGGPAVHSPCEGPKGDGDNGLERPRDNRPTPELCYLGRLGRPEAIAGSEAKLPFTEAAQCSTSSSAGR